MKTEVWARISAAFDRLCDLPAAERALEVAAILRDEPEIGRPLREMLAADSSTGGWLAAGAEALDSGAGPDPAWEGTEAAGAPEALAGQRLGPWRLVSRLGAGGMGVVWTGERADGAFEQRVAIKLLLRGLETEALRARFLLERQILARLTHPGIARLLDAGSTADGRPYFVMELVSGRPLVAWARERRLSLEARIGLVLAVCDAVDFAHRNLVVHRDLKPSNVLVSEAGEVKLLDFGIAKLLEGESGRETTHLAEQALTPAYAAPEQIRGEPVTTATDVYSLGVLLYELFTGVLPHERSSKSLSQLVAGIEHETVDRPSVARLGRGSGIAAESEPELRKAARRLVGDLDTIALKALAREPGRRYPSARALADDLERHLAGRPISARPDSVAYRVGKFVRRNRLGVAAAGLLLSSLVAGLAGTVWQANRAAGNARRAERVKEFLVDVFRQTDPAIAQGRELTAREVLDHGVARLEHQLAAEPALLADLDEALAEIHQSLGLLDRASELGERALAARQRESPGGELRVAHAQVVLGSIRRSQARPLEAAALLEPAREAYIRRFGAEALEVASVEIELAEAIHEGEPERALELRRHALAVRLARLGPDHVETAAARYALAELVSGVGDMLEAEPLYRAGIAGLERAYGALDPRVALGNVRLADLLYGLGRAAEAEPLFVRAIEVQRRILGPRHPELANSLLAYSNLLNQAARYPEAETALTEALGIWTEPSMDRAYGLRYLASSMVISGRIDEGAALYEQALPLFHEFAGEASPEVWRTLAFLGDARAKQGRLEESERHLRRAVERLEATVGPKSYAIRLPLKLLAETERRLGRLEESIALLRQVRALEVVLFGTEDHREIGSTDRRLGVALTELGSAAALAEARRLLDSALALDRKYGAGTPALGESLLASARLRARTGAEPGRSRAELEEAAALFATLAESDPRRRAVAAELARR
jgi:serine/threonine protein kinase